MRSVTLAGALVLLVGCGRTGVPIRDGAPEVAASGMADAREGASEPSPSPTPDTLADRSPDLQEPDAALADGAGPEAGPDIAMPPELSPLRCPPLARDGVINLGRMKQALFAADGTSLLARIGDADSDAKDEARLIQLPSGESRVLWPKARNVEWLGQSRTLITTTDNELVAATLDGNTVHITSASTCSHKATPDGLRVYFTTSGCDRGVATLSVLDVVTGTVTQVATGVSTSTLAVSPDSRWAAYVAGDASSGPGAIYVVDSTGAIARMPDISTAMRPTFASGSILLFQSADETVVGLYSLDFHDVQALAEGDVGIAGYEMTSDGSVLLVAKPTSVGRGAELYRVGTEGAAPVRMATDLIDYRVYSMVVRAFAFAPSSKRILYIADRASDGGRSSGISSLSFDGKDVAELSTGNMTAVMSSYADRVALVAADRTLGRSTISVVSASGSPQFSVEVQGNVWFSGFVPGDHGMLYIQSGFDTTTSSNNELVHLSFASGKVTRLGGWQRSTLMLDNYPVGITAHEYPADPRGCYTVVDSDMDQTAARLVAIPD